MSHLWDKNFGQSSCDDDCKTSEMMILTNAERTPNKEYRLKTRQ